LPLAEFFAVILIGHFLLALGVCVVANSLATRRPLACATGADTATATIKQATTATNNLLTHGC